MTRAAAVAATFAVVILAGATASAAPPRVYADAPWVDTRGYTPFVVEVQADGPRRMVVTVSCADARATETLEVPAGRAVRHTVLLPPFSDSRYCQPRLSWRTDADEEGRAPSMRHEDPPEVVAIGERPDVLDSYVRARVLTKREVPDRWQAWPEGVAVILPAERVRELDAGQLAALRTFALAGGRLYGTTGEQVQDAWQDGVPMQMLVSSPDYGTKGYVGGGSRVPGTEEVPTTGFMILALLFAILVGPVNFSWALRRKKRSLLLITTPLLSALTCGVLIGYNLFAEGTGTRRIATEVTLLVPEAKAAVGFVGATYFAGFSVDDMVLPPDARLVPLHPLDGAPTHYTEERPLLPPDPEATWTPSEQELDGAWIPARRNRPLGYVVPRAERRRLTVKRRPDGGWQIDNGLGVGVTWVSWRMNDTTTLRARGVPAGGSAPLLSGMARGAYEPEAGHRTEALNRLWTEASRESGWLRAQLEEPLEPIPGPEGSDERPVKAFVMMRLGIPSGSEGTP